MDLYINDDFLDLFRLVQQRNVLAKNRFNKRQRLHYLSKILDKKLNNKITGKHSLTPVEKLRKDIKFAKSEYDAARKELASFTKQNRFLRLELQRKFKTKQINTASNTVEGVKIEFLGSTMLFTAKDIDRIMLDAVINDILLEEGA